MGIDFATEVREFLTGLKDDYSGKQKKFEENQKKLFEAFKEENDKRISNLAEGKAVSELTEKVDKIGAAMDDFQSKAEKELTEIKRIGSPAAKTAEAQAVEAEVKSAFDKLLRTGNAGRMTEGELEALSKKQSELSGGKHTAAEYKGAMIAGNDPEGGIFVLPELDKTVMKLVREDVALMRLARNVTTGTSAYQKRVRLSGAGYTWEGEETHPATTDTPTYGVLTFPVRTIAANPSISQELLQDADVTVENELMDALVEDFSDGIGDALINGNDNKRPRGMLSYPAVADANWEWGKLGFTKTGGASGFAATAPGDALIGLISSLKTSYLAGARFLMNKTTMAEIRKMKDGQGNYLWQPSFQLGTPNSLLGYPVELDTKMPDLGANKFPVAFGNFERGYLVVNRSGINLIRDPYSQKPYVIYSCRRRIGGGVYNFEAIKLLKCAA